ncbi:glycoside hydrolase family 15 protein [Desulfomonile tiedjei]|uniref:Glycosyl hydrolase, glucoamylase n=1 Tax=Desulfomonile tiedjei (strain ATCC 49306 / DSM 6799 / DCB-1) TaxID=706587 RepID=I4C5A3_DESTA|nr:glycoside hydrolase family 15 protein [Desulfomonile tiedjei]AFM24744.1 glycosyl hydrolase, glucoamylase [Desulfomonile tiedjei DSM 6799]
MPRDIPVGNGKLLVCFDSYYRIRDLYFPHVGKENHVGGNYFRFGVWIDGRFSWVGEDWKIDLQYMSDTLVTDVNLYNEALGILLRCNDTVDFHENVFVRKMSIENFHEKKREIRVFFASDFSIFGNDVGDTAAFDPKTGGIVHYKDDIYFLVNGKTEDSEGLTGFAVGQKRLGGLEGTYRDAEDGELSGNPIAQGAVDSVISISLQIEGTSTATAYVWICAGRNWEQVRVIDGLVKDKHPDTIISRTSDYWHLWVSKENPRLELLPDELGNLYRRSLLILRTQIDWKGGILAGNDSDVIRFNRDTYSYVWPRDGAIVANALDQAGFSELSQRFYQFAADTLEQGGYLLHKYNPDGTLASSWHPWLNKGHPQLPIQEDETALVIWALWHHFVYRRDVEFIKPLYKSLIKKAADFMCDYRDKETGLPAPSYDIWEERRGILSFTVAAVFSGITAASLFCEAFGEKDVASRYMRAAAEIRDGASTYLWRPELNRFCRMIFRDDKGALQIDSTRDASLAGLFAFGLYSPHDPKIITTMEDLRERLWVKTEVGGMARYEGDIYHRVSNDFPGNPWFVCTLWLADFFADRAETEIEVSPAVELLKWVANHALPSGVLAEQVHPLTGAPLSVSPLTWSHATFVATVHRVLRRLGKIKVCPECGMEVTDQAPKEHWLEKLYADTCNTIYSFCQVR